jgi:hypothetical protein
LTSQEVQDLRESDVIEEPVAPAPEPEKPAGTEMGSSTESVPMPTELPPADAAPPAHMPEKTREYKRRIKFKDTNYLNEELGEVELMFEAIRTKSGQIYVVDAWFDNKLDPAAKAVLSVGANIISRSYWDGEKGYARLRYEVHVGGPKVVTSSVVGARLDVGADLEDKLSAKGSFSYTFSTATTTSASDSCWREILISSELKSKVKKGRDMKGFRVDDDILEKLGHDTDLLPDTDWIIESY